MEIIADRHVIITSQPPVVKWYEVIGEKTTSDANLDRIVHDAHPMEHKGEYMRKKKREWTYLGNVNTAAMLTWINERYALTSKKKKK